MSFCCCKLSSWFTVVPTNDLEEDRELYCNVTDNDVKEPTPPTQTTPQISFLRSNRLSIIKQLHKYLFLSICKDWLTTKDVIMMDSSFCNMDRPLFLKYIGSDDIIFSSYISTEKPMSDAYLLWLLARNMNVALLYLNLTKHYRAFETINMPKLKELRLINATAKSVNEFVVAVSLSATQLETLCLSNTVTRITDATIWTVTSRCNLLTTLTLNHVHNSNDCNIIALILKHCSLLSTLNYSDNVWEMVDSTETDFVHMVPHYHLTSLNIARSGPVIYNHVVTHILPFLKSLQSLDVSQCPLNTGGKVIPVVPLRCAGLLHLNLTGTKQTDKELCELLDECPQLRSIDLVDQGKGVTGETLVNISRRCRALTSLSVRNAALLNDAAITSIARECTQLQVLNLHGMLAQISDSAMSEVGRHCRLLTELNVAIQNVTKAGILSIVTRCHLLTLLHCTSEVDDSVLISVGTHCPCMQSIHFQRGDKITSEGLVGLSACSQLQLLHIRDCEGVSDEGVVVFAEHTPLLTTLRLMTCKVLTDAAVEALSRNCRKLQVLDLGSCYELTDVGALSLIDRCLDLQELNFQYCSRLTAPVKVMLNKMKEKGRLKVKIPM